MTNKDGLATISRNIHNVHNRLEHIGSDANDVLKWLSEGKIKIGYEGLTNAIKIAQSNVNNSLDMTLERAQDGSGFKQPIDIKLASEIRSLCDGHLRDYKEIITTTVETEVSKSSEIVAEKIQSFSDQLKNTRSDIIDLSNVVGNIKIRVQLASNHIFLRNIVFGMVVPSSAYLVALLHAIGKLGFVLIPSLIMMLLKCVA